MFTLLPGVLHLLIFGFSIIAAVLAIDMYALMRTGELGISWRILVIASVLFVMVQVLSMSGSLFGEATAIQLSRIVELVFIITLAYAFYRQRVLYRCQKYRHNDDAEVEEEQENE